MLHRISILLDWSSIKSTVIDIRYAVTLICWILAGCFGMVAALRIYARMNMDSSSTSDEGTDIYYWGAGCVLFVCGGAFIDKIF